MAQGYKIRILFSAGSSSQREKIIDDLEFDQARQMFVFYVSACMEFSELSVRCVNLLRGNKCLKLFQNYGYTVARGKA